MAFVFGGIPPGFRLPIPMRNRGPSDYGQRATAGQGPNPGGPGPVFDGDGIDLSTDNVGGAGGQNGNPLGVPIGGHRSRNRPQPWMDVPNPLGFLTGQGMGTMANLGDIISQGFGFANAQSSANRQAAYGPEAAMDIARINNDAENYRTNARLAAQLASMGMLGKIMGGFTGSLGGMFGGGGYGGGMGGFKATDSPQAAGFGAAGPGQPSGPGRRFMPPMPYNAMGSPTRMAMFAQRYGG